MKSVLVYHSSVGPVVWDTSTDPQRAKAFLELFKLQDAVGLFENMKPAEYQMHHMASRGNPGYAEALLVLRKGQSEQTRFFEATVYSGVTDLRFSPITKVVHVDCPEALEDTNVPAV